MAPQLRNLLQRKVVTQIGTGLVLATTCAFGWKYGYAEPKKAKYTAFYKGYDADKAAREFEAELAKAGKWI